MYIYIYIYIYIHTICPGPGLPRGPVGVALRTSMLRHGVVCPQTLFINNDSSSNNDSNDNYSSNANNISNIGIVGCVAY